jgi:hypothetical protein
LDTFSPKQQLFFAVNSAKKGFKVPRSKGKDQVKGCVNRRFALLNDNTEV